MLPDVDFDSLPAVSEFVRARFKAIYPGASDTLILRMFKDVDDLFAGRHPDFLPIDLHYHNLRHTLMATVCMGVLLEGRRSSRRRRDAQGEGLRAGDSRRPAPRLGLP